MTYKGHFFVFPQYLCFFSSEIVKIITWWSSRVNKVLNCTILSFLPYGACVWTILGPCHFIYTTSLFYITRKVLNFSEWTFYVQGMPMEFIIIGSMWGKCMEYIMAIFAVFFTKSLFILVRYSWKFHSVIIQGQQIITLWCSFIWTIWGPCLDHIRAIFWMLVNSTIEI